MLQYRDCVPSACRTSNTGGNSKNDGHRSIAEWPYQIVHVLKSDSCIMPTTYTIPPLLSVCVRLYDPKIHPDHTRHRGSHANVTMSFKHTVPGATGVSYRTPPAHVTQAGHRVTQLVEHGCCPSAVVGQGAWASRLWGRVAGCSEGRWRGSAGHHSIRYRGKLSVVRA